MAGATQLAVTGAFARASLSAAVYQLQRVTRRPRCCGKKEKKAGEPSLRRERSESFESGIGRTKKDPAIRVATNRDFPGQASG